jgi:hypothetical protein
VSGRPSPILLAAFALSAGAIVVGLLALRRAPAAPEPEEPSSELELARSPASARPSASAPPTHAALAPPKLITEVALTGAAQLWSGADELTGDEHAHLVARDIQARQEAAAQLGLSESERLAVSQVHQRSDAALAELASRAAGGETTGAVLALRTLANQELKGLAEALGPKRAAAFRQAESAAYRAQWRHDQGDVAAAAPVRSYSRRRLTFLRVAMPD